MWPNLKGIMMWITLTSDIDVSVDQEWCHTCDIIKLEEGMIKSSEQFYRNIKVLLQVTIWYASVIR